MWLLCLFEHAARKLIDQFDELRPPSRLRGPWRVRVFHIFRPSLSLLLGRQLILHCLSKFDVRRRILACHDTDVEKDVRSVIGLNEPKSLVGEEAHYGSVIQIVSLTFRN